MEPIRLNVGDDEELLVYVEEETTLSGVKYLLVTEDESEDCDAYILKEVGSEDEDVIYEIVEDDDEFEAVAKLFSELIGEDADIEY